MNGEAVLEERAMPAIYGSRRPATQWAVLYGGHEQFVSPNRDKATIFWIAFNRALRLGRAGQ